MSGVLKKSLASWRDAYGFGILCILGPRGERFVVAPSSPDIPLAQTDISSLKGMSEPGLRTHLRQIGLSQAEIDEAVQLSREWATTTTGSGLVFWPDAD
jgi:hypothetical protein